MNEVVKKSKPLRCVVKSANMDKSRVGYVERLVKHESYGKYLRRSTRLMFHDESNSTKVGDIVLIELCKPMSKNKKFRLKEVVRKAGE